MVCANLPTSLDRDIERRDPSSIAVVTESLAESMQSAGQHAKSLHLVGLDPESLFVTSATRYLFAGLKHLKLDIWYIEFMLESAPVSSTFANLFECCQRTLQTLEIMGGEWPKLPSEDEHYLIKIFSEEQDVKAPVFPELRVLGLLGRGYPVLNTTSLISFIACQPQLQSLSFNNIYLASSNIRWPAVVSSFPDSVRHWRACGRFGNEPSQEFMPPVAYNWIKGAQEECGWKPHPTSDYRWIDFYR